MIGSILFAATLVLGPQPLHPGFPRVEHGPADFIANLDPGTYRVTVTPRRGDAVLFVRSETSGLRARLRTDGAEPLPLLVTQEENFWFRVESLVGYEIAVWEIPDTPAEAPLPTWRATMPAVPRIPFGEATEIPVEGLVEAEFYVPNGSPFEVWAAPAGAGSRLAWATLSGGVAATPYEGSSTANGIAFRVSEVLERWYRLRMEGNGRIRVTIRSWNSKGEAAR